MDSKQKKRLIIILSGGVLVFVVLMWLIGQEDKLWDVGRYDGEIRWINPARDTEPFMPPIFLP